MDELETLRAKLAAAERAQAQLQQSLDVLKQTEQRFRDTLSGSSDFVYFLHSLIDQAGQIYDFEIVQINPVTAKLVGKSPQELIGQKLSQSGLLPHPAQFHQKYAQIATTKQPLDEEILLEDFHGQSTWLYHQALPLQDGVWVFVRNINQRKSRELEAQERVQQQAAVAEFGRHALEWNNLNRLKTEAVQMVARFLKVEFVTFAELQPGGSNLIIRSGIGWEKEAPEGLVIPINPNSLAGTILHTTEPVVVEDWLHQTRLQPSRLINIYNIRSSIGVLLGETEQPFGTLAVHTARLRTFSRDDVNFLQSIANLLATAVERERLAAAEHLAQLRLAALADLSDILSSSLDYHVTLNKVSQLVIPQLADWCVIHVVGANNQLERVALMNQDPEKVNLGLRLTNPYVSLADSGNGLGHVIQTGKAIIEVSAPDSEQHSRPFDQERFSWLAKVGFTSVIIAPLAAHNQTLGTITLINAESKRNFAQEDLAFTVELARRVGLALDNARLYREAQETVRLQAEFDALKNLFLSTATHELRSPLTAVKGYTQILQRNIARFQEIETLTESHKRLLDKSQHSAESSLRLMQRMENLINELLDFSRLNYEKLELNYTDGVNLVELVQRVVEQHDLVEASHPVIMRAYQETLLARVDEARLEQVLINLISNAIKYSPHLSLVQMGIEYSCNEQTNQPEALFWVQDEGLGISPADQAHIFDRFYRVRSPQTGANRVDGLGLGLYISYNIVIRHGGRFWLTSELNKGSTFYFSIPLTSATQA